VSGDEVAKKLKQNINTVHILTLMVAFQYGTIHDVASKVGDYNKTGGVPGQPQAVNEHMVQFGEQISVHRKSVKVKVNTLMYGQFSLATGLSSLLAYTNKSPRLILI